MFKYLLSLFVLFSLSVASIAQPFAGQICNGCTLHDHHGYYVPTFEEYWAAKPVLEAGESSGEGLTMKSGSYQLKLVPSEQSIYNPGDKKFCELAEKASWFGVENHEVWYQRNLNVEVWAVLKFIPDPGSPYPSGWANMHLVKDAVAFVEDRKSVV